MLALLRIASHRSAPLRTAPHRFAQFSNIAIETRYVACRWWGNAEPIWISSEPRDPTGVLSTVGTTFDVRFVNITARSENGALISGGGPYLKQANKPPNTVRNITLKNVSVTVANWTKYDNHGRDYRPCIACGTRPPLKPYCGGRFPSNTDGLFLENIDGVWMEDVEVAFEKPAAGVDAPSYWGACYGEGANVSAVKHVGGKPGCTRE